MASTVEAVDPEDVPGGLDAIERVYRDAFTHSGGTPSKQFRSQFSIHREREAFRFIAAIGAGRLKGFGYGYVGRRGDWWPEWLVSRAGPGIVEPWLDGDFEVVELAVDPAAQGVGLGRRLFERLVTEPPSDRGLLTTERANIRARTLYESCGWSLLVADLDGIFCLYGRRFSGPRHLAR